MNNFIYPAGVNTAGGRSIDLTNAVPGGVINLVIDDGHTPARAWREYLEMTQEEVAPVFI